jgi:hypothetical protein
VTLYFFERITEDDFVGPVIVAAGDEEEAWTILSKREGHDVEALQALNWAIAQDMSDFPARPTVVYPRHYRRAILQ